MAKKKSQTRPWKTIAIILGIIGVTGVGFMIYFAFMYVSAMKGAIGGLFGG